MTKRMEELVATRTFPERIVEAMAAFGPAYLRWAESRIRGGETTYTRMRLLGALYCAPEPQTMGGISAELGVTARNVTTLVDALEQEGLVRRRAHPTDRRATLLELTEAGRALTAAGYAEQIAAVGELFADLSEERQRDLLETLEMLRDGLRRRGIVR